MNTHDKTHKESLKKERPEEKSGIAASKKAVKEQALKTENWESDLKQSEALKSSFAIPEKKDDSK